MSNLQHRASRALAILVVASCLAVGGGLTTHHSDPERTTEATTAASEQETHPMFWHLVIRIVTNKAACENIRRIMPNGNDLKCISAGKVWVLIPKGQGW